MTSKSETKKSASLIRLGLSLFCTGAGAAQIIAPDLAGKLCGLEFGKTFFRIVGLRDLIFATGIFATRHSPRLNKWWLRLIGTVLIGDAVLCGRAMRGPKANKITFLATLNSIFFVVVFFWASFDKKVEK